MALVQAPSLSSVPGILSDVPGGGVSIESGMQAAIIVDLSGESNAGKTGGVKRIRVRLVVLLGDGMVDVQGIGLGGASDRDAYHRLGLERGAAFVLVGVFVEVDAREQGEPCAGV